MEASEARELQRGYRHAAGETVAAHLHIDLVQAAARADERGGAHDRFDAEHSDLYLKAVSKGVGHGTNAILDEDEVFDGLAGVFYLAASLQGDGPELEASDGLGVEGAKDPVFKRARVHTAPLRDSSRYDAAYVRWPTIEA